MSNKPKLVFFQYHYDKNLPEFLLIHKQDHVKCLSHFFDVKVVNEDCDYREICETHEPDLALFELGVNHVTCRRLSISNTGAHPRVPKLGLHNADPFCDARAGFLSDMENWGIVTAFAISTTAAEHTPEIAERLFVWPNFVDPDTYRDYGEWKSIPVLLAGNKMALYPWRRRVAKLLVNYYPVMLLPHPGYGAGSRPVHFLYGEPYARTLNASWFVPSCGTVAREIVRKHFEVPASRSCLVAEPSAALDAAGFVDMENCVLANERDVVDKLASLFGNRDELQRITDAGHQLVHSRHTYKQRGAIRQWLELRRGLAPGHEIIQPGPFDPLVVVPKAEGRVHGHIFGNGLHLALLRQGDALLQQGKYPEAERLYLKCANYIPWMPEPQLRAALCRLHQGRAAEALATLDRLIRLILVDYGARDPDPVEWAYSMVALLGLGRVDEASARARQFPWLHHPELDRARAAVSVLGGGSRTAPLESGKDRGRRPTIHRLPERGPSEWIADVCRMLAACGRPAAATKLKAGLTADSESPWNARTGTSGATQGAEVEEKDHSSMSVSAGGAQARELLTVTERYRRRSRGRGLAAGLLHRLERRVGYFLPYRLSAARSDEFYLAVHELMAEEAIDGGLVLGAASGKGGTEAFIAGALANVNEPKVYCVAGEGGRVPPHRGLRTVRWVGGKSSRQVTPEQVEVVLAQIRQESGLEAFDAVLLDVCALTHDVVTMGAVAEALRRAEFVLLEGINCPGGHEVHQRLLGDPAFVLLAENPDLRHGYGMFRSTSASRRGAPRPGGASVGEAARVPRIL